MHTLSYCSVFSTLFILYYTHADHYNLTHVNTQPDGRASDRHRHRQTDWVDTLPFPYVAPWSRLTNLFTWPQPLPVGNNNSNGNSKKEKGKTETERENWIEKEAEIVEHSFCFILGAESECECYARVLAYSSVVELSSVQLWLGALLEWKSKTRIRHGGRLPLVLRSNNYYFFFSKLTATSGRSTHTQAHIHTKRFIGSLCRICRFQN